MASYGFSMACFDNKLKFNEYGMMCALRHRRIQRYHDFINVIVKAVLKDPILS